MRLWEFPKATIAQVHGYCVGGAIVYGLLTDLIVAADDAYCQMPLPQGFGLPGAQTMIEPWVLRNGTPAAKEIARTITQMPLTTIMATKAGLKRAWEMMGSECICSSRPTWLPSAEQPATCGPSWPP